MVWLLILILQDPHTGVTVKQHSRTAKDQAHCVQLGKDEEARWHSMRPELRTYSECVPVRK